MTDRKKPGWAFWTTVVVVVAVVGYPLSIGPAWWCLWRYASHEWAWGAFEKFYAPILWCCTHGPKWLDRAVNSYMDWGLK